MSESAKTQALAAPSFTIPGAGMFKWLVPALEELGGIMMFYCEIVRTLLTTKGNWKPIQAQIVYVTARSLPTVLFSGFFVGAIIVVQFNQVLQVFNAQVLLGGLDTSACVREVGPLMISFLLAGKIGAYTAAELGTMRVTEQIDAVKCLGTDPLQYLVVPRFFGIVISAVILLFIGLTVSVAGSIVVAQVLCGMNAQQFLSSIPKFTNIWTLGAGMAKSLVYATIVAGVSTYKGYTASGGARGVGQAVTMAAVMTNVYIILANYFTGTLLNIIGDWYIFLTGGYK